MGKILCAILILTFCSIANASETSHRAAAENMLLATKVEENTSKLYAQMKSILDQQYKQMNAPEGAIPILTKYRNKQIDALTEVLSWPKIKDDTATAYMKVFSEEDLIEITKFFNSPIGVKYVSKMPELFKEATNLFLARMPILTAKYKLIEEEMVAEMAKYDEENQKKAVKSQ